MTGDDLARGLGVSSEQVTQWQSLGLIAAGELGPRDVERARLVQGLLRRGVALAAIARADREDGFLSRYTSETAGGDRLYSIDEAAAQIGVDVAVLQRLADAARVAGRGELLTAEDVEAFAAVKVALDAGFPEEAVRQLVRVYVDALGKVADAENRLFHFYVHDALRARGVAGSELLAAGDALREQLIPLIEPVILYFHRQAWDRAQLEDAALHLHHDAIAPAAGGPPGQLDVAIAFVDLAGFTSLTEAMGDEAAAEVLERFSQMVRNATAAGDGRVVKQIGDAFMLVFSQASAAVTCALEIERHSAGEPQFAAVRTGIHFGRVLYREGDYVGTGVNVAARLAAAAERHQILVSASVRERAGEIPDVRFVPLGARRFRGLGDDVAVHAVTMMQAAPPSARAKDPVCGMELDAAGVAARLALGGHEYVFCSEGCLQRFAAAPDRYTRSSA